jgi:hypothetical protein
MAWDRRQSLPHLRRSEEHRRGARVAEWAGLENRCILTDTEGSNPSLSACIPMQLDAEQREKRRFLRTALSGKHLSLHRDAQQALEQGLQFPSERCRQWTGGKFVLPAGGL